MYMFLWNIMISLQAGGLAGCCLIKEEPLGKALCGRADKRFVWLCVELKPVAGHLQGNVREED